MTDIEGRSVPIARLTSPDAIAGENREKEFNSRGSRLVTNLSAMPVFLVSAEVRLNFRVSRLPAHQTIPRLRQN